MWFVVEGDFDNNNQHENWVCWVYFTLLLLLLVTSQKNISFEWSMNHNYHTPLSDCHIKNINHTHYNTQCTHRLHSHHSPICSHHANADSVCFDHTSFEQHNASHNTHKDVVILAVYTWIKPLWTPLIDQQHMPKHTKTNKHTHSLSLTHSHNSPIPSHRANEEDCKLLGPPNTHSHTQRQRQIIYCHALQEVSVSTLTLIPTTFILTQHQKQQQQSSVMWSMVTYKTNSIFKTHTSWTHKQSSWNTCTYHNKHHSHEEVTVKMHSRYYTHAHTHTHTHTHTHAHTTHFSSLWYGGPQAPTADHPLEPNVTAVVEQFQTHTHIHTHSHTHSYSPTPITFNLNSNKSAWNTFTYHTTIYHPILCITLSDPKLSHPHQHVHAHTHVHTYPYCIFNPVILTSSTGLSFYESIK